MTTQYKTELHVHTRYSKDSYQCFILLLAMCKLRGINTLVITDHDEVKGALRYRKGFRKHGVEIIPGEEVFTAEGEIIGVNLKKRIEPGLSPEETIIRIKAQGGLVIVPHPYDEMRYKTVLSEDAISRCRKDIDFMEVHNGRNRHPSFDTKQKELADRYGIKEIIGSDAHTFFELGRNYIITERPIRGRLKAEDLQNISCVTGDYLPFAISCTRAAKALKMIMRGDFNGLFRAVYKKIKGRN